MKQITVTKEMIEDNMRNYSVRTITEFDKPVCCVTLKMKNGFTLVETSTCVDPSKYSEEIGKEICLKRLEDKVWYLLGFLLQEKISEKNSLKVEQIHCVDDEGKACWLQVGDEIEAEGTGKMRITGFEDDGTMQVEQI